MSSRKVASQMSRSLALVTGAASGIGRATALRFASEGMEVVALDRSGEALETLIAEGRGAGPMHACRFDLSRTGSIPGLVKRLVRRHGAITVLVNNAAVWFSEPLIHIQDKNWDMTMRVNVTAPMALMRAAALFSRA